MSARRSVSTRDRARLFAMHGGLCHICGEKIDGTREKWEVEHVIPWAYSRDDSDENRRPAHVHCHKEKTVKDRRDIDKVERMRMKHIGAWRSKSPMQTRKERRS